jgi:hypothetical protein
MLAVLRRVFFLCGGIPIKMLGGTSLNAENVYDKDSGAYVRDVRVCVCVYVCLGPWLMRVCVCVCVCVCAVKQMYGEVERAVVQDKRSIALR